MAADDGVSGMWSETVEDLVENGDVEGAITLLESVVSKLESLVLSSPEPGAQLQLATALGELADLHSRNGMSLKADELRSHSLIIRARVLDSEPRNPGHSGPFGERVMTGDGSTSSQCQEEEDDWETVAIRDMSLAELSLSEQPQKGGESDHLNASEHSTSPRRRGRGSFLYRKNELYSDQLDNEALVDGSSFSDNEDSSTNFLQGEAEKANNQRYGTSHVILLYEFPPTTRTTQLENLFDTYRDSGVAIRWVSDTVALAVFRTPSAAHEAYTSIVFPFKARALEEKDIGLFNISTKDLEPPLVRPKTSARTAQRLISHAMGIQRDMSCSSSRSDEFRKQEAARKNRILSRQNMRHDAWGPD